MKKFCGDWWMGGVYSLHSFHSMMNKKSPRITRINANNSGVFRMSGVHSLHSINSVMNKRVRELRELTRMNAARSG
jgi:hypothetical protein